MNTFFDSECGGASRSCPCGCRGQEAEHDAFEAGFEGEAWRRGHPAPRRPPPTRAPRPRAPRRPPPRPVTGRFPLRPRPVTFVPAVLRDEPLPPPESGAGRGSERTRWAQDCLNHALGMRLPVTGILGAQTRSALRSFQRREGLRPTGILGPDTVDALRRACRGGGGNEEEISAALQQMPPSQRPNFRYVGALSSIPRTLTENGPGLYMILFKRIGGRPEKAYVGISKNLKDRLLQHLWCLTHLGLPADGHRVFIAPRPGATRRQLKAAEKAVNNALIPKRLVTNVKPTELEGEEEW